MEVSKWTGRIDEITRAFQDEFGSLSEEQLNRKPAPDKWSIAQNLEHLIVINGSYFPALEKLRAGTYKIPFTGKIGFLVNFMGNFILKFVQPDRKTKMKTFKIWEPSQSEIPGDILHRFAAHQEELKRQIRASEGLLERGARISSPANKYLVYDLGKAFDIIVSHEERHLEQCREVVGSGQ